RDLLVRRLVQVGPERGVPGRVPPAEPRVVAAHVAVVATPPRVEELVVAWHRAASWPLRAVSPEPPVVSHRISLRSRAARDGRRERAGVATSAPASARRARRAPNVDR